jgi:hypothetical protein
MTCWSLSEETKVIAKPFVPNRPARLEHGTDMKIQKPQESREVVPNAVQITIGIRRTVIVDDNVDSLNVDTTTKNIRCDENTFFKCLKGSVAVDTDRGSVQA